MSDRYEYRVIWKRSGLDRKVRRYATLAGAQRYVRLFGPEPWTAFGDGGPDDFWCCSGGPECACEGETNAERAESQSADMPDLEYARIERREVGTWEAA